MVALLPSLTDLPECYNSDFAVSTGKCPEFPRERYSIKTDLHTGFELREIPREGDIALGIKMYAVVYKGLHTLTHDTSYNDAFCLAKFLMDGEGEIYVVDGFVSDAAWIVETETGEKLLVGFN